MTKPAILHIAQDQKFINAASFLFEEAFPGQNKFIIVKSPANPPTKYISNAVNAEFMTHSKDTIMQLALLSDDYAVIILHGVNTFNGSVFLESAVKNRFVGIIFGAEIYNRPHIIGKEVLGTKTKKLYQHTQQRTLVDSIKNIYRKIVYRNHDQLEEIDIAKVLYKIDTLGSLPSISYDRYIDNKIYNPSVTKIPFSYYPIEFIIKDRDLRVQGSNILFGNSAWPTNNHIEGFEILQKCDLNGRNIVTPLSYGPRKYAKAITVRGKRLFGDRFKALSTFLPLKEYNQLLRRCGIVIMNHFRPQAMGNIIASLFMGGKVFLNETDAYWYLKDLGCYIYLIESDLQGQSDAFQLLSDEQVELNRQVLMNELSASVLVEQMRTSFREIFDFGEGYREVV